MNTSLKLWFFGTPELARQVLADILADGRHSVEFVVTNIDKKIGRKQILSESPVKMLANEQKIPIFQPEKIRNNTEFLQAISSFECDYFIVVAYGKILSRELLDIPKKMCINIHGSLLPAYRGASPIQSALLNGEKITGVTIMKMGEKMDEGDMILQEKITIAPDETALTLFEKFGNISGKILLQALEKLEKNKIIPEKQNDLLATYCGKITKEHGEIDWNQNAKNIYQQYQAYTPWPWIFAYYQGKRVIFEKIILKTHENNTHEIPSQKIFKHASWLFGIAFSDGILLIEIVKPEWKKSQKFSDFINGNQEILNRGFDEKNL